MSELAAQFAVTYPRGPRIDVDFRCPAEGFAVTTLFGPSGCGKTTVLRALAGLKRPSAGLIHFQGQVWFDAAKGLHTAPQRRNVGYLFQDYVLFPHLDVAANIGYGLRRDSATERARRVGELLERFDLKGLDQRRPSELSSGQQQRVALARALARRPQLLLLDEPLSALDAPLREQMRRELRHWLQEIAIPTILVTHDRLEALALTDQLLVMHHGRIVQAGPVREVFARPSQAWVARLVGVENVVPGIITHRDHDLATVQIGTVSLNVATREPVAAQVLVCIRAEDVRLEADDRLTALNQANHALHATIQCLFDEGPYIRMELDGGFPLVARVARGLVEERGWQVRHQLTVRIPPHAIHVIPSS